VENSIMRRSRHIAQLARRAFTLIELLTVIGILAIVIAIIIPAMNLARRAAKNADTRSTLSNLSQAISLFNNDKRHYPGYFGTREMGAATNASAAGGFDTMSNIMLDLMGGVTTTAVGGSVIAVGPSATTVNVDLASFGATQQSGNGATVRGYFVPDGKKMVAQSGAGQRFGGNQNNLLPSLVDAFGQPILAWAQDETPSDGAFAVDAYTPATPAKFYWAQNAAFLKGGNSPATGVTSLGKLAENQTFSAGAGSLLSDTNTTPPMPATVPPTTGHITTMLALLGNPAAPDDVSATSPKSSRGPIILHAAGADGVFVGAQDRGGKSGVVKYTANQDSFNGPLFDDQIMAAGH
jgi:prepilin-type N-terminal cleavage/methylation domain-containing protein